MNIIEIILIGIVGVVGILIIGLFSLTILIKIMTRRAIQQTKNTTIPSTDPLLADINPDHPAIIYFTAEWCAPCKLHQTPIIETLANDNPDLLIMTVDLDENRDVGKRWGVMGLPRTFVIGKNRHVHATNMGIASANVLNEQIQSASQATQDEGMLVNLIKDKAVGLPKFKFIQPEQP